MSESEYYENYAGEPPEKYIRAKFLDNPAEMERFRRVVDAVPATAETLLDVGCGAGLLLRELGRLRSTVDAHGIERSRTTREAGRQMFGVDIREGSADCLPYPDRSFDVVSSLEVIEHLPFGVYDRTLTEIQRVAQSTVVITVPYQEQRDCR